MNRVFALRSGTNVTLNINGAYSTLVLETEEEAEDVFKKALEAKLDGSDAAVQALRDFADPSFRIADSGILEKDRVGRYFLKGYKVPVPETLVQKIKEYAKNGYPLTALENFWKLCMLNPDDRAREDLFTFADQFHFPITDSGYFIAYKSVAGINMKNKNYGLFIAQQFVNMKAAMHENPADFSVIRIGRDPEDWTFEAMKTAEIDQWIVAKVEDEDFSVADDAAGWMYENHKIEWLPLADHLTSEEVITLAKSKGFVEQDPKDIWMETNYFNNLGTLEELFHKLNELFEQEEMSFTDWHTKKMTIKLGQVVEMERKTCDTDPQNACSYGLHVGAPAYVTDFNKQDDQFILAVLVNPAHVIAVPKDHSFQKMRVCEYYPYAICEVTDKGYLKELETPYFEANYCGYEKNQLEAQLRETQKVLNERIDLTPEEEASLQAMSELIVNRLFLIGDAVMEPAVAELPTATETF
jgi:hypothetical protein